MVCEDAVVAISNLLHSILEKIRVTTAPRDHNFEAVAIEPPVACGIVQPVTYVYHVALSRVKDQRSV